MNNDSTASPESTQPSHSRRNFIGTGLAGLTAMGLTGYAHGASHGDSAVRDLFFETPIEDNGDYAMPTLPYAYNALEPAIDEQTMRLHHDIHFNGYRVGLNRAFAALKDARLSGDFSKVQYWEGQMAFHGAGFMLHLIFFQHMAPHGSSSPTDRLKDRLAKDFQTFEAFQAHFEAASTAVEASGWGILGYQPVGSRLVILQAEKHQNLTQWGIVPMLALDVWEHAYYLKYQNRRAEYVKNFWDVVDWATLERRIAIADQQFG